jgi:hypothetical protein
MIRRILALLCLFGLAAFAAPKKALIIDGRNNHDWRATTPVLKQILEEKGLFKVDVVTAPADNEGLKSFNPSFKGYAVVVLNYNDFGPKNAGDWPEATQLAFRLRRTWWWRGELSAARQRVSKWLEFNKVIGLGGWSGNEGWPPHRCGG